jgi:nucleotide-binding universal stress UspA family protein
MRERVVLFPTDFSERSIKALRQAIGFARRFHDKMIILHVYSRPYKENASAAESKSMLRHKKDHIDEKFDELLEEYPKLKDLNYEFRSEIGVSVDCISETTQRQKIDLIIMATKGARGLGEIWGTTTAKIVKSVEVPVLILPDDSDLSEVKKLGLACDYSEHIDYRKLEFLVEVAESQQMDIDVFTLNRDEKSMTSEEIANQNHVKEQLESVNTTFSFHFHNNVEEGVIDYAKSKGIGVIAIMPKSYFYIERLFHESLTERMAFHSPFPLLVLK